MDCKNLIPVLTGIKEYNFYRISPIASGCLMMISSGSVYLVTTYSASLQTILDMSSTDIASFSSMVATGSWLGIIPMAFTDLYGPKMAALIGAVMILIGYVVLAAASNKDFGLTVSSTIFLGFIIGHGSAWVQVAGFFTNVANTLPKHRGAIFGLLQANYALSSGIFTQIYEVFELGIPTFLLVTGLCMFSIILIAFPSNHYIIGEKTNQNCSSSLLKHSSSKLSKLSKAALQLKTDTFLVIPLALILFSTAVCVAVASILESTTAHILVLIFFGINVLGVIILSCIIMNIYGEVVFSLTQTFEMKDMEDQFEFNTFDLLIYENRLAEFSTSETAQNLLHAQNTPNYNDTTTPTSTVDEIHYSPDNEDDDNRLSFHEIAQSVSIVSLPDDASSTEIQKLPSGASEDEDEDDDEEVDEDEDLSAWAIFQTLRFWLLFVTLAVGGGAGVTVLYNLDKIVDAHSAVGSDDDVHASLKSNLVALFSAFNTIGRIGFGFASDWLLIHKKFSRAWLLAMNSILMGIAMFLFAFVILSTIKYIVILCAFSYGGFWILVPALIADIFGTKSYGGFFTLTSFAPIIGIQLLYNLLSTQIYDEYTTDDEATCFGNSACFKMTFLVIAGLCLISALAAAMVAKISQRRLANAR